ncbi:hypothetical protein CPB84DRAFT_1752643 [Gymnopilus junonius]|uniref:Uncharacterized protein n=1 Tax=Gymnopilus junonius TaxID=109634 RepID=A0A9P5NBW3_GYMJU|nr:hypothetical protein CPB84DRAFT_1752643 [Gymnopilus junonius]
MWQPLSRFARDLITICLYPDAITEFSRPALPSRNQRAKPRALLLGAWLRMPFSLPLLSDRQKHANALLEAYILQTIIEAQESASVHDTDSTGSYWEMNSEKAGSDNGSDASSGWGMEIEDEYKTGFPDIFCSYLCITPDCFNSLL